MEIVNGHRRGPIPVKSAAAHLAYRAFVRCVRYCRTRPKLSPANRYWWKCRLLFGLRVGDINSKFKLFRRTVFDRMVLQSDGEFIHAEILAKANFLGCLMDEVALGDRPDPLPAPDVGAEMWTVFRDPRFRSPVPTPGLAVASTDPQTPAGPVV